MRSCDPLPRLLAVPEPMLPRDEGALAFSKLKCRSDGCLGRVVVRGPHPWLTWAPHTLPWELQPRHSSNS